jgi:hypothetical protein
VKGKISIEDDIWRRYWQNATDETKRHVLSYLGRALKNTKDLSAVFRENAQKLWEFVVADLSHHSSESVNQSYLQEFGYWFTAGCFNASWAISQFLVVLDFVDKVESDHDLFDRIVVYAVKAPQLVLELMKRFESNKHFLFLMHYRSQQVYEIFALILRSEDQELKVKTKALLDVYGSHGFMELKELALEIK